MSFTAQSVCVFAAVLPTLSDEESDASQCRSGTSTPNSAGGADSGCAQTKPIFGGITIKNTFIDVDDADNSVPLKKRSHSLNPRRMAKVRVSSANVSSEKTRSTKKPQLACNKAPMVRLPTASTTCSEGSDTSPRSPSLSGTLTPTGSESPGCTISGSARMKTILGSNGRVKNTFIHIDDADKSALTPKRSHSMPPRDAASKSEDTTERSQLHGQSCGWLWQAASLSPVAKEEHENASTCEGGDTECDGASSVGKPYSDSLSHIDTDSETEYSPNYVDHGRKPSSFIDVMNNSMIAPNLLWSEASPPCLATSGPKKMRAEAATFIPSGATAALSVLATDGPVASQPEVADVAADNLKTSVLLRNLPDGFKRNMLMDVLRDHDLAKDVDFLYVPADFNNKTTYGYGFVNLTTPEAAELCLSRLNGFSDWCMPSEKACEASWGSTQDGLRAYIERYRNSRIMHDTVDDEYKPAIFANGVRIPFPLPTKSLRAPRLRKDEDVHTREPIRSASPPKSIPAPRSRKEEDSDTLLLLWTIA